MRKPKQRMRTRLLDAIAYHDPDFAFERAVMGDEHYMQLTHKQLKRRLNGVAHFRSVDTQQRVYVYDGKSGKIMVK